MILMTNHLGHTLLCVRDGSHFLLYLIEITWQNAVFELRRNFDHVFSATCENAVVNKVVTADPRGLV